MHLGQTRSTEEDTSHSALSMLPLQLVCPDTCALSASTQHAATVCSIERRCRNEDFGQEPPFSLVIVASLLLSEIPLPSEQWPNLHFVVVLGYDSWYGACMTQGKVSHIPTKL